MMDKKQVAEHVENIRAAVKELNKLFDRERKHILKRAAQTDAAILKLGQRIDVAHSTCNADLLAKLEEKQNELADLRDKIQEAYEILGSRDDAWDESATGVVISIEDQLDYLILKHGRKTTGRLADYLDLIE
jgi:ArsR family metal-binding transcriptional regulator